MKMSRICNDAMKKVYADWEDLSVDVQMRLLRKNKPENASIGRKVFIEHYSTIGTVDPGASLEIGDESIFWEKSSLNALVKGRLKIGRRCLIGNRNLIYCRDSVEIGDHVMTSWDITIYDYEAHPINPSTREKQVDYMIRYYNPFCKNDDFLSPEDNRYFENYWNDYSGFPHAPVKIGNNCWIGYGVSIMKGVTIGDNCIIAAKSVVTKSIPPNCMAGGCPARVLKDLNKGNL
jgi:acetyltransferase-like isoleucine patch superfamily enzyme